MPKLVIFRGDAVEHEIHLTGRTVRIGRDNGNELVLDDKSVSRFHAEVRAEAGTYFIVDAKSRNGVWLNGQQIKGKTALALGVPVTLGAYELALEDDVSSGEFGEEASLLNQHTVVSAASVDQPGRPSRSATQRWSTQSPAATAKRSALFWSGLVLTTLLLCGITYSVVRYTNRPAPIVAQVEPPPVVVQEPPPPPPPPPVEDPTKAQVDQYLVDARAQMDAGDFAGAVKNHLQPALELQPENTQALELKRQADEAVAAADADAKAKALRAAAKPVAPAEVETPGIPRRANEAYADYTTRVRRIQGALAEGKSSLDKQEFVAAIAHFRAVERDQPRYQGVDLLMTDTLGMQQKALEEAIGNGQQNEQAGKLREARLWYLRALEIDPGSTGAREKNAALLGRMTTEANRVFDRATFAMKSQDTLGAIRQFQQIVDLMLPGDEIREKAAKQLEALKR